MISGTREWRLIRYWGARIFLWRLSPRPPEMYQAKRAPDGAFSPDELLYFWYNEVLMENGQAKVAGIRCPDQSVNRGKYSYAWHLLLPGQKVNGEMESVLQTILRGVAVISVADIPVPIAIPRKPPATISFVAEHAPEHDNYAHSEVRAYDQHGTRQRKVSDKAKLHFRLGMSVATRIVIESLCLPTSAETDSP